MLSYTYGERLEREGAIVRYLCLMLVCIIAFSACRDPEAAFVEAIDLAGELLDLQLAQRQRPERVRENRELADFLKKNLRTLERRLDAVAAFRQNDPVAFDDLFLKYRPRIVAVLTKMETIHRHERAMLRYLPLVLAPVDTYSDEADMGHYKNLFVSYYEYIYSVAQLVLE